MPPKSLAMCTSCFNTSAPDDDGKCPHCGNRMGQGPPDDKGGKPAQGMERTGYSLGSREKSKSSGTSATDSDGEVVNTGEDIKGQTKGERVSRTVTAKPQDVTEIRDYDDIINKTKRLIIRNYRIYGLFGWAHSGKSSLVHAIGKCAENSHIIEGYRPEGNSWKSLYNLSAKSWATRQIISTRSGHYHYPMVRTRSGVDSNLVFVDIAGEDFRNLNENEGVEEFFCSYLPFCSGFIFLVNPFQDMRHRNIPDEIESDFFQITNDQLGIIAKFISSIADLAAIGPKINNDWRLAHAELEKPEVESVRGVNRCNMPISICFSQADMWGHLAADKYLNGFCGDGAMVPVTCKAWEFLEWISPGRLRDLLDKAPKLQIAWLSSLGPTFQTEMAKNSLATDLEFKKWLEWWPKKPLGLKSVFDFVIEDPPNKWVKATSTYYRKMCKRAMV